MHRPITSRWYDAIQAEAQCDHVASLGFFNDGANHCFSFAVKEPFGKHRRPVACAPRLAGRIAGLPWLKSPAVPARSLLFACIFSHSAVGTIYPS